MKSYYREKIWLIGDGRSGTTWLCDLINHKQEYRTMFEPFHPALVDRMDFLFPHQYVRVGDSYPRLFKMAAEVFSGNFFNTRVDAGNPHFFYKRLLVKDIFAQLFAAWAAECFPELRIILLVRNPFAVAWSKSQHPDWFWGNHPLDFLNQHYLFEDHLAPFAEQLLNLEAASPFVQHMLTWCILHYVLMRDMPRERVQLLFFEQLLENPQDELQALFRIYRSERRAQVQLNAHSLELPSEVRELCQKPFYSLLSAEEIQQGSEILKIFGLDSLYAPTGAPHAEAWESCWSQFYRAPVLQTDKR